MAKPKVVAIVFGKAFVGFGFASRRRNDDAVADQTVFRPIGGHRDTVRIGNPEHFDGAQNFFHIAADFLRIIEDEAHFALGIANKDRAHGVRAFSGMQESEFIRNRIVRRDDGEGDFDSEFFFDPFDPFQMALQLIDRKADQFDTELFKLGNELLKRGKFGRADRRKIGGMAEQHKPAAFQIAGNIHFAQRRRYAQFGKIIAQEGHVHCRLFHKIS